MATAGVLTWSQTAASNSTADPAVNWAEGQAPSSVNDSARAMMSSVAKWRDDICGILVSAGTSTAYTLTTNETIASNLDGATFQFTPGTTNGGATTLSVDSNTAKPLRFYTGVELPSGSLISGSLYQATYRAATQEWLLHGFDSSVYAIPLGASVDFWGTTAPNSSFVLAYGQAISRSTYATLFSLLGTTFGTGDGSTTFNIPDLRGRLIAGKDDMGGSAASRLTSTYFGTSAAALGAVGGSQSHTLTAAEIPTLTSTGNNAISVTTGNTVPRAGSLTSAQGGGAVNIWTGTSLAQETSTGTNSITVTSSGTSGNAHAIVPPTIIANKLLRII